MHLFVTAPLFWNLQWVVHLFQIVLKTADCTLGVVAVFIALRFASAHLAP